MVVEAAAVRAAIVAIIAVHGPKANKASAASPVPAPISKAAKIAVKTVVKASTAASVAGDDAAAADVFVARVAVITAAHDPKANKVAAQFDRSVN